MPSSLRRVGFFTPPGWFDPTVTEFARLAPAAVAAMGTVLPREGLSYESLDDIRTLLPLLEPTVRLLAESRPDAIAQVGVPFSHADGRGPQGARERAARLSEVAGCPVLFTGTAMIDAARALNCARLAAACTYYDEAWTAAFVAFLRAAGFEVAIATGYVSLGLLADQEALRSARWRFPDATVCEAIRRTAAASPDAEAVMVAGAGTRTLAHTARLEAELGLPVIGADVALFRAVLRTLGLPPREKGNGRLLDELVA